MEKLPKELIETGKLYPVTVLKILGTGIIVHIKDTNYTEFIHISEISTDYVSNINEYISIGSEYMAKGQISKFGAPEFTLKHLGLKPMKSKPDFVTPKQMPKNPKSFEDMIAAAEQDFKDKQRGNRGLKKDLKHAKKYNNPDY